VAKTVRDAMTPTVRAVAPAESLADAERVDPQAVTVADVASRDPVTVEPDRMLEEISQATSTPRE
jgi:hypothetical protein